MSSSRSVDYSSQINELLFMKPMAPYTKLVLEGFQSRNSVCPFVANMKDSLYWVDRPDGLGSVMSAMITEHVSGSMCMIPTPPITITFDELEDELSYHVSQMCHLGDLLGFSNGNHLLLSLRPKLYKKVISGAGEFVAVPESILTGNTVVSSTRLRLKIGMGVMDYRSKSFQRQLIVVDLYEVDPLLEWKTVLKVLGRQLTASPEVNELIGRLIREVIGLVSMG